MFNPRLFARFLPPILYLTAACHDALTASEYVLAVVYLLLAISHLISDMIEHNDHPDS